MGELIQLPQPPPVDHRNYAEIRIYEDGQEEIFIHADTVDAAERLKGLL